MKPGAIPIAIGTGPSFHSKLLGIIPMLMQDNSTCKFQCSVFLKLGSHYPPLGGFVFAPLSFACGIIQLTDITAPILTFRLCVCNI
jgi:hypothetical protein